MNDFLLDTDILSYLMRGQEKAKICFFNEYEKQSGFYISVLTLYELLRGLERKQATQQTLQLKQFLNFITIISLDDITVQRAAQISANLMRAGNFIGDFDILIASTALSKNMILVSNNIKHFSYIPNLTVESWIK